MLYSIIFQRSQRSNDSLETGQKAAHLYLRQTDFKYKIQQPGRLRSCRLKTLKVLRSSRYVTEETRSSTDYNSQRSRKTKSIHTQQNGLYVSFNIRICFFRSNNKLVHLEKPNSSSGECSAEDLNAEVRVHPNENKSPVSSLPLGPYTWVFSTLPSSGYTNSTSVLWHSI